jgi:DNA-binding NtrC family response regulator
MLVITDIGALPASIQELIARASADYPARRDVQIALTSIKPPKELAAQGHLVAALAARLSSALDAPVFWPRLQDRPEDFRSILTDRLAREGLRIVGRPVGIDQTAYARLSEYGFPGEDVELFAVVQRLVSSCHGGRDIIRSADIDRLGLGATDAQQPVFFDEPSNRKKDPLVSWVEPK